MLRFHPFWALGAPNAGLCCSVVKIYAKIDCFRHYTVKVHCCVLELMSRQLLEQITEESIQYKMFQSEQNLRKMQHIGQLQAGNGDRMTG